MTFKIGRIPISGGAEAFLSAPLRYAEAELSDIGSLHVIGRPGEGKSTFLGRMAEACIDAGEGVLLIDPKGDLAKDVALRTNHPDKLIYISPGSYRDRTFCLNVLEADDPEVRDIVAGNFLQMFKHMGRYDESIMTLVGKYLSAAVLSVYTKPNPTLIDVHVLLINEFYRREITDATRLPNLKWFWDLYDKRTSPEQRSQIDSTLGRLWDYVNFQRSRLFVANPSSTIHLADWLNQGKLIVVNLAQGLDEPDAHRIGNLMVAYLTTQYRLRESELVPWSRERRWRLMVDEFHEFAPNPFAQIIRNGRAFNFFPVVAHQDMAQLEPYPQLKGAIGLASRLSFLRSDADAPITSAAFERFRERQETIQQFEADWTHRRLAGTTTTRLKMPEWNSTAKPTQLDAALDQAIQYTLPKSAIPSLDAHYQAWRQGGTMEDDATPTKRKRQKTKDAPRPRPQPDSGQAVPDEPDPARAGRDAPARPSGILDVIARRQDLLLGGDDDPESEGPTPPPHPGPGPKRRQ